MPQNNVQYYKVFEPFVYAATGNRFQAGLVSRAQNLRDVVDITMGTSPIITEAARETMERRTQARTTGRTASIASEDIIPGLDLDWGDLGDLVNTSIGDTGQKKIREMMQHLMLLIGTWQLRDLFGVGESELKFAEGIERTYLNETAKLMEGIGTLIELTQMEIVSEDKLAPAAEAMYFRTLGRVRDEALRQKDEATARLAGMGASTATIASYMREIDDMVLSKSAEAHQQAEILNQQITEQNRQFMTSLVQTNQALNENFWKVAQQHFGMGMQEAQQVADMAESMLTHFYRDPDIQNIDISMTQEGGGGGIGIGIPGLRQIVEPTQETAQEPAQPTERSVNALTLDEAGNVQLEATGGAQEAPQPAVTSQLPAQQGAEQDTTGFLAEGVEQGLPSRSTPRKARYVFNPNTGRYERV